jgi:UDP-N-acetylglucosamine--N-acetylmuramyl-(pentapeptide) pyrophosphoryl-undecaprenol N-acetylglucosamine transferase
MSPNRAKASHKAHRTSIILTGGGSGGHITPLLSLAHELKKQNSQCKLIYIGLKREKLEGLKDRYGVFDEASFISAGKFRRYHGQSFLARLVDIKTLLLNIRDFFKVLVGFFSARRLLKKSKPNLVFSKGGFVAVPVGLAAKTLKIPIVTHDSDSLPGLANKIIGRWAEVHTTGMADGSYPYPFATIKYVGIPIDERLKIVNESDQQKFKQTLGIAKDNIVLLVGGAGLGSESINNLIINAASDLLNQIPNLHIINITGQQNYKNATQAYKEKLSEEQLARVQVLDFTSDFYIFTGAADLIVTRAGATTIAELAVQHKACVLIPAPFLTDGHQLKNAESLMRIGAVEVFDDKISVEEFSQKLITIINNAAKRKDLAAKLGTTARPKAANQLAKILLSTAEV